MLSHAAPWHTKLGRVAGLRTVSQAMPDRGTARLGMTSDRRVPVFEASRHSQGTQPTLG
jgi:hypothetical protein